MSKIYELDISLFKKVYMYPTYDKFIFTTKNKRSVVAVDNSYGEFFTEDFSNKMKGFIYLANEEFMPDDVEKEYTKNKNKYKNYSKFISTQNEYFIDRNLSDRDFLNFDPNKKYEFDINIGFGKQRFKGKIEDALGLSLNYESDLLYNSIILISPLGFEWNDNLNLMKKYLDGRFIDYKKDNYGIPYRSRDSKQIEWIEKTKEKNMNI